MNIMLRKRIVKCFIPSVVLDGSETWTLLKEDKNRLQAFKMWIWRRMMKVSWKEHRTNEDILSMVQEERCMVIGEYIKKQTEKLDRYLEETHL